MRFPIDRLPSWLRFLFAAAFACIGGSALATAQDAARDAFAQGNAAFAQAEFDAAAAAYEEALRHGSSANLHYNLGSAYARQNDWGRATLHLLKALALNPNLTEARTQLALIGERSGLGWDERTSLQQAATLLALNTWTWLSAVAFWLIVFLLGTRPQQGVSLLRRLGIGIAAVAFVTALAAMGVYHFEGRRGVVLNETHLRIAPTAESPTAAAVEPGLLGDLRKTVNGFHLVRTKRGDEGYLAPEDFAPVWE